MSGRKRATQRRNAFKQPFSIAVYKPRYYEPSGFVKTVSRRKRLVAASFS